MTAEIGILNPMGVALAADSAVTISTASEPGGRTKIYNSANKLFSLSKFHPVGIMVYGNAALMGFPWETIIKVYRQKLGSKQLDHLNDYCEDFFRFLEDSFISNDWQEQNVTLNFESYLSYLIKKVTIAIDKAVDDSPRKRISETASKRVFSSVLDQFLQDMETKEVLPCFDKDFVENLKQTYTPTFLKVIEQKFSSYPLTQIDERKLIDIGVNLFVKPVFSDGVSGVVLAGFGKMDLFPSLRAFDVEYIVNNRVKRIEERKVDIDFEKGSLAAIAPFAQQEMVGTFISGIDPQLEDLYANSLHKIFAEYPKIVVDLVVTELKGARIPKSFKTKLTTKLGDASQSLFENFQKKVLDFRRQALINPIVEMAAYLPKDELAAMAEALVNLTSFKRRISTSDETVGGPIDVAVISKGDGFIWVKRKHYFKPELNRHFFDNYFRGLEGVMDNEQEKE